MTRECSVCKQTVLIEYLQDPGGVCRDCYAEAQIRNSALGNALKQKKEKQDDNDRRVS